MKKLSKKLGKYELRQKLGHGGMGVVYKAYQEDIDRFVALKLFHDYLADDPEIVGRFKREARVLAKLQHPHILTAFDYDQSGGIPYIVMPYIEGGTLADLLKEGALPLWKIRRFISQLGDALDYAHTHNIVHRDIKPTNVLVDNRGHCQLADFGIVKVLEATTKLTQPEAAIGTPQYMSPEQISGGKEVDKCSDIYSLGVLLYEMVTGRVPFTGRTITAVYKMHLEDSVPLPSALNADVPSAVESVILKALEKKPEDRYQTVGEMLYDLKKAIPYADTPSLVWVANKLTPTPASHTVAKPLVAPKGVDDSNHVSSNALTQIAISSLELCWVVDPLHVDDPYAALNDLYISPRNSMEDIQRKPSAKMNHSQREAWRQLRSVSSRLFVDSFLYRVKLGRELSKLVKALQRANKSLLSMDQVPQELHNEWPLVLLLADNREICLDAWRKNQLSQQTDLDATMAHNLAIASLFKARQQNKDGQHTAALISWQMAIANWAWLLAHDDFWADWTVGREQSYKISVTKQQIITLRQQLREHLTSQFRNALQNLPRQCAAEIRQAYQELPLQWEVEVAGVKVLQQFQQSQTKMLFEIPFAGPMLITELGIEDVLAQFVSHFTHEADDIATILMAPQDTLQMRQNIQEVRIYFSQFGKTAVFIDQSQPDHALSALHAFELDDFDLLNPPYKLLPNKQHVWEEDRAQLTMRIHLQFANTHLQQAQWDIEAVKEQWNEILSLGTLIDNSKLAFDLIQDQAISYLQHITYQEYEQQQQMALAEAVIQMIGRTSRLEPILRILRDKQDSGETTPSAPDQFDLETLLQGDKQFPRRPQTSWEFEAKKLYAVLEVNPDDEEAREQLVALLSDTVEQRIERDDIKEASRIINDWYEKLETPVSMQTMFRYVKQGHKVASLLSQTGLVFSTRLLDTHSYRLKFHQHHLNVFVTLKVVGDLVQIHAPLPVADMSDATIQYNLLRVTGQLPLFKACRNNRGDYGLLLEVLAGALTPNLLKQLLQSIAGRADLKLTYLQELEILQQSMDTYMPDLSLRVQGTPIKDDFERWERWLLAHCRQKGMECTMLGDFVYRISEQARALHPIQLDFQDQVITLQVQMGAHYQLDHSLYDRMLHWNSQTDLCKLGLSADNAVTLRCEILDIDSEETLSRVLTTMFNGVDQAEALLRWHLE